MGGRAERTAPARLRWALDATQGALVRVLTLGARRMGADRHEAHHAEQRLARVKKRRADVRL